MNLIVLIQNVLLIEHQYKNQQLGLTYCLPLIIKMSEEIPKFKIIFLGDQGVGKSSILNRFAQDKFESNYQATIGLDFHSKNVLIDNVNVRLLLYDTAGQEKFKSLIPMYIRDANIIIVVYDITSNHNISLFI